ncbi:CAP domain-containing protein [Desemzia sp. RIT804]|uniref:CAP domain-containing protein n=1 Tax=Desemzia sp. RIT 804 TaxID=2810209 RepID=UPI0019505DF2|nr:CAP domain-containing protein [Desemzia sp. RIT 804]MBM6614728.1 CAP domain-containing protein [Desemzia sp. RIT 804]
MTKLLGFIVTVLVSIMFGFWLAATNILDGTQVGNLLYDVVDLIPVPDESNIGMQVDLPEEKNNTMTENEEEAVTENSSDEIDYNIIENRIFELLNELRSEVGVQQVTKNQQLKLAADQRALETEELFEHTRPDGSDPFTVLEESGHEYNYRLAGENLAMATYYLDELGMAEVIFNGWKNSEGHYENMIKPEFEEVGIGIHYDGDILYSTQIFGTPR